MGLIGGAIALRAASLMALQARGSYEILAGNFWIPQYHALAVKDTEDRDPYRRRIYMVPVN